MTNTDERISIRQFPNPLYWRQLQRDVVDTNKHFGLPDRRVDCVVNSMAFVGILDLNEAETIAESVNARGIGITPISMLNHIQSLEKKTQLVVEFNNMTQINMLQHTLKEGHCTLLCINKKGTSGHAAIIAKVSGVLMVFDPQYETYHSDIHAWLTTSNAVSYILFAECKKHGRSLNETTDGVRKSSDSYQPKRIKTNPIVAELKWKPRAPKKCPTLRIKK